MNVHLYPLLNDTRKLCARFDLLVMLPVGDWFELFELAEKAGQSLPAYIVTLLKNHIQDTGVQRAQEKSQEPE